MNKVRVKQRVAGPDTNGHPRSVGEIYDTEETRARKDARDGFVELIDENGQGVPHDAKVKRLGTSDVLIPAVTTKPTAPKKKAKKR